MKRKLPPPRFAPGDNVTVMGVDRKIKTDETPRWNGLTYMYAFDDTDLRCGEMYVRPRVTQQSVIN